MLSRTVPILWRKNGLAACSQLLQSSKMSSGSNKSYPGITDFHVDPFMGSVDRGLTYSKDVHRHFKEVLPDLIRELTYDGPFKDVPKVNEHVSKCLQYNLMHGKHTRGLAVPVTFKLLASEDQTGNEDMMKDACVLGWCIEFMQASYLVADDIMDGSATRRGQPCWYKKENIGMMAINDGLILESCIYSTLQNHFAGRPLYPVALDAFLTTHRNTTIGQSLDMLSQVKQKKGTSSGIDDLTMKLYSNIVKYKTAYYSFFLPVQLGMGVVGIQDPELHRQALNVLLEIGKFFQIQDDYLDCFGDPEVTGKQGTDITDGKCSWLIVMAMQRANPKQKEVLRECYGSEDRDNVKKIKELYEELKLPELFLKYEEETYNDIITHVGQMSTSSGGVRIKPEVFYYFLNTIYKRDK